MAGVPGQDTGDTEDLLDIDFGEGDAGTGGAPGAADGGGAGQEDARATSAHAAVDEDNETPEQRRERRRNQRQQGRQFRQQQTAFEAQLIAELTNTVRSQSEQLAGLTGKIAEMETGTVINTRDHWVRRARHFKSQYAKAVSDGDGEKAAELQEALQTATTNAQYFDRVATQRQQQLQQLQNTMPQQVQQPGEVDPSAETVQRNGQYFLKKHGWYDPSGSDADSRLVKKLDAQVMADGFNPATKDYWVELERRMATQGLIDDDAVEGGRAHPAQTQTRNERGQFVRPQGGPPVGGRTEGTKRTVTVPEALKTAMKEAGQWDDPAVRKRVVTAYYRNLEANRR